MKMMNKIISLSVILCFTLSCISIPHYKELYVDSRTEIYQDHTLGYIWGIITRVLVENDYMITSTDRIGGIILAKREYGHPGDRYLSGSNSLMILVQSENRNVVVICTSRVYKISAHPREILNEFFESLNGNI